MSVLPASEHDPSAVPRRHAFHTSFQPGRAGPGTLTITVRGEVDASNTDELAEMVETVLRPGSRLVLDCSAVTFLAVEGFSVLQRVNVLCARAGVAWVLIPSAPVSRVFALFAERPGRAAPGGPVPVCPARATAGSPRLRLVRGG